MDITRWSILKSEWLYPLQPKREKLYTVSKTKTGSSLWLRSWTPYCQIQTEIEERRENHEAIQVWLTQIPYDYTMEVTNKFKVLYLIKCLKNFQFSRTQWCLTLCNPMDCSTPGLAVHHQLMSIESVMPSNYLILCHSLLLLPSIFPSIRVFSSESVLRIRWPKYWSFSFNISPSNEYSGLISFRMDWLDLLAVQGTLKSLLQHHSSKASVLRHSAFFITNSHIHTWPLEKP